MRRDAIAALLLIALVAIAHGPVLAQWWLWDDPQLLFGAMRFGVADHFTSPAAWQQQSSANFVPMLAFAMEVDYGLFGVEPRGFYAHHLLVFAAAIVAVYAWLRRFTTPLVAAMAAGAIALARPSFTVASLLMDRHYAEGLLFSTLALILFGRSHERPWRAVAATLFYLVACLEKEIFVPLPLLVVVQDWATRSGWRVWLRNAALCGIATVAYVSWRIAMLGSFGGFGSATTSASGLAAAGLNAITGTPVAALFVAALVLVALRRDALRASGVVLGAAIVVALPLAGLAVHDSRYFFFPAVVVMTLSAIVVRAVRSIEFALFAALAVSIAIGGVVHCLELRPQLDVMQTDGLYLWNAPSNAPPLLSGAQGWYLEGVRRLRADVKRERAPEAVASVPGLVVRGLTPSDVAFTKRRDREALFSEFRLVQANFDPAMPLRVEITRRGNVLSWSHGPGSPGDAFFFVTPAGELVWTRTASGWVRIPAEVFPPTAFAEGPRVVRVMRRSGTKWTYSPQITMPGDGRTATWSRW